MPIIEGYSRESFQENYVELKTRLKDSAALAASYNIGRKAWRRRHGKLAPYPPHLREPHGHLLPQANPGSGEKAHSLAELRRHGLDYWKDKPTISSGQTHDLKYDDGKHRVWATRMTAEDYDDRAAWEREKIIFERHFGGRWHRVSGLREHHRVRQASASATRHASAPSATPSANVYWTQIPRGAPVVERPHVFIAKRADGEWAVVNWSGHDAFVAQQSLRRWARAGKRTS